MSTEHALRQSQKMEAVGQLTGGIAHDFNNLLAGIGASLQILQTRLRQGKLENVERYIGMGQDSVRRAAALTQRLLAFARRQTLDPKATDVNRLITGMEELIRRTVGPSVEVEVVGAVGLWTTKIDPSQLENSLLNLCINARDAMLPGGGRLTIETANKWLDERAALERELVPGQYVSLCVTDTGSGMTPEVVKRVFDPFFTTKPIGQGTGLGLSMVYGFVRQSGGQVRIYSEIGKGTTMCLYLPRHLGEVAEESFDEPLATSGGDGECVLLIEDEATIRVLITEVLEDAGYQVVSAADGATGLRTLQSLKRVDLLITDVGLPGGMNGRQVADAARVGLPNLKVLFITGYAENAAVGNGLLGPDMEVLTKPFEISLLAKKVHDMTGKA
jgi:CheY-like chemotaxis protein